MSMQQRPTQLTDAQLRSLRREYLSRQRAAAGAASKLEPTARDLELADTLSNLMFPPQRALFDSPNSRKVGFCTRRAGKTIGIALEMLRVLLRDPTRLQIYFAQTGVAAKTYLWPELKKLIRQHNLPITWNEQDLWLIHKYGGGKALLRGAEDSDDLDKHRGPAWVRVYIDEAGHIKKNLKRLLAEIAGPALRDHGGVAIMTGTAGDDPSGFFYDACMGNLKRKSDGKPVWEVHEWGLDDNPHLPPSAKNERTIIDEDGFFGPDDPRFLREYKRIWAVDRDARMFAFDPGLNVYSGDLPSEHDWHGLLGIDFGWNDHTAIAVIFYSLSHPKIYIPETWAATRQFTDDIAEKIFAFQAKYGSVRIIGDVGGYGKSPCVHLQRDYGIHVVPAKKREKLDHLAFFNSALKRCELLIKDKDPLTRQMPTIKWNPSRTGAANHARDDRAFAALYGWREAKSCGAGSRLSGKTAVEHDQVRAAAIKEKLDVLNAGVSDPSFAHHRAFQRVRDRRIARNRFASFHQLVAPRRP